MEARNIWDLWSKHGSETPEKDAIVVWKAGEEPFRWSFSSIISQAERYTLHLKKTGIKKGEVVAIIIRHNKEFFPLYMGIVGLGAIPAVLAYPNPRLHPDKFRQGIIGMSHRSGLDWIMTEREIHPILEPLISEGTVKGVHFPLEFPMAVDFSDEEFRAIRNTRSLVTPDEPMLLQHSSGTTGLQKPVLLSHGAVVRHADYYGKSIQVTGEDKVVSWLPLYHDMGLIAAFHMPLAFGIPSIQIDPFEWVLAPVLLFEALSHEKATLTWLPNFAYNLMADKIHEEEFEGMRLDSLRMVINCSEPVRYQSHERFKNHFKAYGFREEALATCYAMAETTYAVTQSEPGKTPAVIYTDREKLGQGILTYVNSPDNARICVSSGKVIEGCRVEIVDDQRKPLGDNKIGEIAIQSVSMFDGYRNYPEKTEEVLKDGWYYSGDFGFMKDGECFVIGRKKDIIIVAGKNIYPEDVEDTLNKVPGVLPGRVIAFGADDAEVGTEVLCVIVESEAADQKGKSDLRVKILEHALANDQSISRIYIVPPRWLIKSSAGKPSRKHNKERVLESNEYLVA
ncbi:MAG: AMP-binding protein [Ignavibacteriales bacterium]|nr:MAG: AMP-binding protein [Ignavibacteriales bacterium]